MKVSLSATPNHRVTNITEMIYSELIYEYNKLCIYENCIFIA